MFTGSPEGDGGFGQAEQVVQGGSPAAGRTAPTVRNTRIPNAPRASPVAITS